MQQLLKLFKRLRRYVLTPHKLQSNKTIQTGLLKCNTKNIIYVLVGVFLIEKKKTENGGNAILLFCLVKLTVIKMISVYSEKNHLVCLYDTYS